MALRSIPNRIRPLQPRIRPIPTEGGFAKEHYRTTEHRAWSDAVKARDNYTCQECGARKGETDRKGRTVILVADHIVEIRDGGSATSPQNGRCLCLSCHGIKTGKERQRRAREAKDIAL